MADNLTPDGQSHGINKRHAGRDPVACARLWDIKLATPLRECLRAAIVGEEFIALCVIGLNKTGCPAAILFAVWPLVVNTIQRVLTGWTWPHVGGKCRKRLSPRVANNNATPAISGKVLVMAVVAPILHTYPCVIGIGAFTGLSVLRDLIAMKTSTTSVTTGTQVTGGRGNDLSAIALTCPFRLSLWRIVGTLKNYETMYTNAG